MKGIRFLTPNYQDTLGDFPSLVVSKGKIEWVSDKFADLAGMQKEALINASYPQIVQLMFGEEPTDGEETKVTISRKAKEMTFKVRIQEFKSFFGAKKMATVLINR